MRNIDRIRAMDAEQLAGFLTESGAPVPTEFCDILCAGEDCERCRFLGEAGDKRAWKLWLERDDGELGPPDYKELYKKLELRVYGPPNVVPPGPEVDLIKRIEKALGFRLFIWQKTLILYGSLRQTGSTTATCVRKLIRIKDSGVIKLAVPRSTREHFEQRELMRVKTLLDKEGIKTNRIQLDPNSWAHRGIRREYGGNEDTYDTEPQEPEELQTDEQGDPEQRGVEKETDKQGSERSDGSGPAGGRDQWELS